MITVRNNGFTLIELLVALTIFAMLAGAGVLLLGNSVSAQGAIKAHLDDMAALERMDGALPFKRSNIGFARGSSSGVPTIRWMAAWRLTLPLYWKASSR